MKKFFTLASAVAMGVAGMSAVNSAPAVNGFIGDEYQMDHSKLSKWYEMSADEVAEMPGAQRTRLYQSNDGTIWDAQFVMMMPACDNFYSKEPGDTSMEDLPYYLVRYDLLAYTADGTRIDTNIFYIMAWPSYYMYNQIWEWDPNTQPTVDTGNGWDIPSELKNLDIVPFSVMANGNDKDWTATFTELEPGYLYDGPDSSGTRPKGWGLLNNTWMGIPAMYKNEEGATASTGNQMGSLAFNGYDEADRVMYFNSTNYLVLPSGNRTVRCNYAGTGMVEGYQSNNYTWTSGPVHIFNTGVESSEIFGDVCPYPEAYDEVTRYMIWMVDDYWTLEAQAGEFNTGNIKLYPVDETKDMNGHFNYAYGMVFSNPDMELVNQTWTLEEPEWVGSDKRGYWSIAPKPGMFSSSYQLAMNDPTTEWAIRDSFRIQFDDYSYYAVKPSTIVLGSVDGTGFMAKDSYTNSIFTKSTQDVIYHYDPADMSKTKTIPAVGDQPSIWDNDGVAGVVADNTLNVTAADGVITVVAPEAGNVSVYSLNGTLVKSAYVAAGETLDVEVAKGLYIVVAGKNAAKVVL